MKRFLRWLGRVVGSALTCAMVIVLLPHLSRIAAKLLPDEDGAAIRVSAILAEKFETGGRLETLTVDAQGVLNYDIRAAFIGSVANISINYRYAASFGIDLRQVSIQLEGDVITFALPQPEVLQDSLRPDEVYRDDFWYPGFSDDDYERILEEERVSCRNRYLDGDYSQQLWEASVSVFEETIAPWLTNIQHDLSFRYIPADPPAQV